MLTVSQTARPFNRRVLTAGPAIGACAVCTSHSSKARAHGNSALTQWCCNPQTTSSPEQRITALQQNGGVKIYLWLSAGNKQALTISTLQKEKQESPKSCMQGTCQEGHNPRNAKLASTQAGTRGAASSARIHTTYPSATPACHAANSVHTAGSTAYMHAHVYVAAQA